MRDILVRAGGAAAFAVLLLVSGCSSGSDDSPAGPAVEDFSAGTCRQAAPDVLGVARQVTDLGKGPRVPDEAKAAMRATQARLLTASGMAAGPEQAELEGLVRAIGLLRLRADGNTYEPFLGDDVRAARERVIRTCTGR